MFVLAGIPASRKPSLKGGINEKIVKVYKVPIGDRHVETCLSPSRLAAAGLIPVREVEMTQVGEKRGLLPRLKGTSSKRQKKTSAGPSHPSTEKGSDQPAPLASKVGGAPAGPANPSLAVAPGPPVINIADNSPDGVGSSCPPAEEAHERMEPREMAPARELVPATEQGPAREATAPPREPSGLIVAQPSGGGTYSVPRHLHPICKFLFENVPPQSFGSLPEPGPESLFLEAGMRMAQVEPPNPKTLLFWGF